MNQNKTMIKIAESMRGGGWDDERIPTVMKFISERATQWAEKLDVTFDEITAAWEEHRDYAAANYYQNANFPKIEGDVLLMDSAEAFKEYCQGKGFVCGACGKNIKSPYECSECGWKTYGLLGPGKGATFIVLRPAMRGEWIFKPKVLEAENV